MRLRARSLHPFRSKPVAGEAAKRSRKTTVTVYARNVLLFSPAEAARAGITLGRDDARARHIHDQLKSSPGDLVRIGVVNGLKVLRRLWATLAELGVAEVIVTHAAKVEKGYGNSKALQTTAILSELRTGLEQAGETVLPNVLYSNSMANAIAYITTAESSPRWSQNEVAPVHGVDRLVAGPAADIHHFEDPLPDAAAVAAAAVAASAAAARSEAALLGFVAGAGGPPEAGQRMAFITQCLHVRRSFADQRAGTAVEFSPIPLPPVPEKMTVCSTLKLVAHPGVTALVSDVVVTFKERLDAAGISVWRWAEESEVTIARDLRTRDDRAAATPFDRYYGSTATRLRDAECSQAALAPLQVLGAAVASGPDAPAASADSGSDSGSSSGSWAGVSGASEFSGEVGGAQPREEGHSGGMGPVPQVGKNGNWLEGDASVGTSAVDTARFGTARVVVAIGPEGGWTEQELSELRDAGFQVAGLGPRKLSTTAATISILAIVQEGLR